MNSNQISCFKPKNLSNEFQIEIERTLNGGHNVLLSFDEVESVEEALELQGYVLKLCHNKNAKMDIVEANTWYINSNKKFS